MIKESLKNIFSHANSGRFLFLGSGFSRRYIGLEDWEKLLIRFSEGLKPFEYYRSISDGTLPDVAQLMAKDFNEYWWNSEKYQKSRELYKSLIIDFTSALRIEICNYLKQTSLNIEIVDSIYNEEINLIPHLNVDGIITTNWDVFLERLFPDYKVYVGQEELLFSNTPSINEIYKIHGCCEKPNSLILTSDDYQDFNEKNTYLAAKLITIFVENPVIFIGYSVSDPNIIMLLSSIVKCVGKSSLDKLRNNLIFVPKLDNGDTEGVVETFITVGDIQLPIILVKTESYIPVYEAIIETKRKIPTRILRWFKEDFYEFVNANEPSDKICVIDIEKIHKKEDIEFVVGLGVVQKQRDILSSVGYGRLKATDLFEDLLLNNRLVLTKINN
jgi:hypothetical protein